MSNSKYFAVSFFEAVLFSFAASVVALIISLILFSCCILFIEPERAKDISIISFIASYCLISLIFYVNANKKPRT